MTSGVEALSAFVHKLKFGCTAKSPMILLCVLGLYSAFFLSLIPRIPVWHDDTTSYLSFEPIRTPFYGGFAHFLLNTFGHPFCIIIAQQIILLVSTIVFCWVVERTLKSWILAVVLGLLIYLKDGSLILSTLVGPDSIFESLILLMSACMIACIKTKRTLFLALALSAFAMGLYARPAAAALAPGLVLFAVFEWWSNRRLLLISLLGTVMCFGLMSVLNFFQLGYWGWQNVLGTNLMGTTAFIIDSTVSTNIPELRDSIIKQSAPYKAKIDSLRSPTERRQYFDQYLVDGTWRIGCPRAHDWVNKKHQNEQQSGSLAIILGRRWAECDNALLSLSLSTILKYPEKYAELCVQRACDYTLRLVSGDWKGDLATIYRRYYNAPASFDASRNEEARDNWKRNYGYEEPKNLTIPDALGAKNLIQLSISWINPLLVLVNLIALFVWLFVKLKKAKDEVLLSISAYCALLWLPYFSVVVFLGQYLTRYFDAVVSLLLLGAISFTLGISLRIKVNQPRSNGYTDSTVP